MSREAVAAGKAAVNGSRTARLGIDYTSPGIDFGRVHQHVKSVIEGIAPVDSVERFEGLGVRVLKETARFASGEEVVAGPHRIRARRFVIATGSGPLVPPIPGLDQVPYQTNETVFDLTERPQSLVVIGGRVVHERGLPDPVFDAG